MAHNLEFKNGQYSFVETAKGAGAWHGLGQRIEVEGDSGIDIKRALEMSQANYEVALQPVVALTPELVAAMENDTMINAGDLLRHCMKGVKATMRMDNKESIGCVSDTYGIVQNSRMFEVLGMLASGKDMNREDVPIVETAGVLGNGERCFVSMKFPEPIRIGGSQNDIIDMYLIGENSHDGSGTFKIIVSPCRVVCQNTLQLAIASKKSSISFRHSRFVNDRIDMLNKETAEMAYKTLGMYDEYKQYFEAELERLRQIKVNDKWAEKILAKALLPDEAVDIYFKNGCNINSDDITTRSKNILTNAMDALMSGVGQDNDELKGTGLHVINGITTYFQNTMNWKDNEKKFISITEGTCYDKLQKVYKGVLELAA